MRRAASATSAAARGPLDIAAILRVRLMLSEEAFAQMRHDDGTPAPSFKNACRDFFHFLFCEETAVPRPSFCKTMAKRSHLAKNTASLPQGRGLFLISR